MDALTHTQVLIPAAGEKLVWVNATGTVPDGAVEGGAWGDGPVRDATRHHTKTYPPPHPSFLSVSL